MEEEKTAMGCRIEKEREDDQEEQEKENDRRMQTDRLGHRRIQGGPEGHTHIRKVERKRERWGARQCDGARLREWGARIQKSRGTGKRTECQQDEGEGGEQERGRERKNSHGQNNRNRE